MSAEALENRTLNDVSVSRHSGKSDKISFPSISNVVFFLIYVAALIYFKILSLPDMSLFERKIKRTQRIIISGKTYLLSIYYVPVSVLRYRKRRNSQTNIWQICSCLRSL